MFYGMTDTTNNSPKNGLDLSQTVLVRYALTHSKFLDIIVILNLPLGTLSVFFSDMHENVIELSGRYQHEIYCVCVVT